MNSLMLKSRAVSSHKCDKSNITILCLILVTLSYLFLLRESSPPKTPSDLLGIQY